MTLGDVAARLDLVPTGVIYYFKNKEELAAAAFLKGLEGYGVLIDAGVDGEADDGRLSAFIHAYFNHAAGVEAGAADRLPVFNDVRALNSSTVNDAYVAMFRRFRGLLSPDLPRLHANARAHLLLSQVFWIAAWQGQAEASDFPRTADRMAAILTHGVVANGVAWPSPRPLDLGRQDDPAASSEQFLRAATCLINEEGYHGASVERISARLNVSKGAFYHHNETKDDLVVACFERTFDIMWRAIRAAERSGGTGLEVLVTTVAALIEHQMSGDAPLLRTSALSAVPEAPEGGTDPTLQPDLIPFRLDPLRRDRRRIGSAGGCEHRVSGHHLGDQRGRGAALLDAGPGRWRGGGSLRAAVVRGLSSPATA